MRTAHFVDSMAAIALCGCAALAFGLVWHGPGWLSSGGDVGEGALARFDPRPGAVVLPLGSRGPKAAVAMRRFVVAVGSCGSCSVAAFEPARVRSPRGSSVAVAYASAASELPASGSLPAGWSRVADVRGEIHGVMNAYFVPRWAEVDASGRLIWLAKRASELLPGMRHGDR